MPDELTKSLNEILSYPLFGLAGVILGYLIKYKQSVRLAKRSEFNELADPLFEKIKREIANCESNNDLVGKLNESNFTQIERRMGWLERKRFRVAINAYENEKKKCRKLIGHRYKYLQPNQITDRAKDLLKFTSRK